MRLLMALGLACSAAALAAETPKPLVLVGGYQTLGVDAKQVGELESALRTAMAARPVQLTPPEEADKYKKGLGLCGEDAACLGSVGERAGAKWVLGYGAGKVGASVLVNLLFVEVATGKTVATAGTKVEANRLAGTAAPLMDELLKNVVLAPPVVPVPPPPPTPPPSDAPTTTVLVVAPDPAPAPVQVVAEEKGRPFRRAAIGVGIGAGVFLLSTVVLGLIAGSNYTALSKEGPGKTRDDLFSKQGTYNAVADTMLGVTLACAAATVVFSVMDASR